MRAFRLLNVAIFSFLIAVSAAVYAQDDKPQEDKPKPEEPKQQDTARPADKQDQMNPRQDDAKHGQRHQHCPYHGRPSLAAEIRTSIWVIVPARDPKRRMDGMRSDHV